MICFILLYLTFSQSPFLIRCLVYRALVQRLVLSNRFEIRLWVTIQLELLSYEHTAEGRCFLLFSSARRFLRALQCAPQRREEREDKDRI